MSFSRENMCGTIVVMMLLSLCGESLASVHKVGGSAGWTILGKVDYGKWTSSDRFIAGDSLLFVYNTQFHNVKQVSRRDFLSCNATSALSTYTSGSDTVVLTKPGDYYYLCGFPGHCQAGQKLHVFVSAGVGSPSLSPSPSPSPATASEDSAQNGAVLLSMSTALTLAMSGVELLLLLLCFA